MSSKTVLYTAPLTLLDLSRALPTHVTLEPLLCQAQSHSPCLTATTQYRCIEGGGIGVFGTQSQGESSALSPHESRRRGRRVTASNQILRLFTRLRASRKQQPPKLENLRYGVIRSFRKAVIRAHGRKPVKRVGLLDVDVTKGAGKEAAEAFAECVQTHWTAVRESFEPHNRPKVDNMKRNTPCDYQTYNGEYLRQLFSTEAVRTLYRAFVELLCADCRPVSLCARFKVLCCSGAHSHRCEGKWTHFRTLLHDYLGADISQ